MIADGVTEKEADPGQAGTEGRGGDACGEVKGNPGIQSLWEDLKPTLGADAWESSAPKHIFKELTPEEWTRARGIIDGAQPRTLSDDWRERAHKSRSEKL